MVYGSLPRKMENVFPCSLSKRPAKGKAAPAQGGETGISKWRASWDIRSREGTFRGKGEAKAVSLNWGFP